MDLAGVKVKADIAAFNSLNDRIKKTRKKKEELKVPELGARVEKRRQDVSLHTISDAGTTAKDQKSRPNHYDSNFDHIVSFLKAKIVDINEIPGSAKRNCSNRETR